MDMSAVNCARRLVFEAILYKSNDVWPRGMQHRLVALCMFSEGFVGAARKRRRSSQDRKELLYIHSSYFLLPYLATIALAIATRSSSMMSYSPKMGTQGSNSYTVQ